VVDSAAGIPVVAAAMNPKKTTEAFTAKAPLGTFLGALAMLEE